MKGDSYEQHFSVKHILRLVLGGCRLGSSVKCERKRCSGGRPFSDQLCYPPCQSLERPALIRTSLDDTNICLPSQLISREPCGQALISVPSSCTALDKIRLLLKTYAPSLLTWVSSFPQKVLNRLEGHTKHCKTCQKALRQIKGLRVGLAATSILLLAAAAVIGSAGT